jgi:hypothetical protein
LRVSGVASIGKNLRHAAVGDKTGYEAELLSHTQSVFFIHPGKI